MLQATLQKTVASPCINACELDSSRTYCLGCLRMLDEIAVWGQADDAARREILSACERRRDRRQLANSPKDFEELDQLFPCVGVCMTDAESGYCLGCGRPPVATPGTDVDVDSQSDEGGAKSLANPAV